MFLPGIARTRASGDGVMTEERARWVSMVSKVYSFLGGFVKE